MACCAILLDAMTLGVLNDDRPVKGASAELQKEYTEKLQHKEKEGKQYELLF